MPSSLLWLSGLAVVLLVIVARLVRPRASWESFRAGALARADRIRREARQVTGAIRGEEALLPLRALLRELSLPAGVSVREKETDREELRVLVTSPRASLMLRLSYSACRLPERRPMVQAGVWRLAVRDAGGAAPDGMDVPPDVWPDVWQGDWPVEERFDDLAACAARLQKYVADPASALRSLHVASDE